MSFLRLSGTSVVMLAGALVLVASAVSLVTSQYRSRSLVVETEWLQRESRRLADDASELHMQIYRAALPGYVASQAVKSGLEPATTRNTIVLEHMDLPKAGGQGGAR